MKKRSKKWVKICPRCGSKDVEGGPLYGMLPKPFRCRNCGFVSYLFPETTLEEAKKLKKNEKKSIS